ncbi:MAG TPA: DUF1189 family protein, partial [Candidatus Saccharimonadales bacterium]|nr:DUF1189 family protein [Candidatus Saccharimonadales bacterium]
FKYFLLLILLVTIFQSIIPVWQFATVGQKQINVFIDKTITSYPSNLDLNIKNGKLSTNVKEPYFITFSGDKNQKDEVQNFAVIDTKTPFSVTQFNKYSTLAWVTSDSILVKDKNQGELKAIDLTKVQDFTLNRNSVNTFASKATPWLKLLLPIVTVGIVVGLFIVNMFLMVYILFVAILIWVVLKLIKKPLSYGEAYKVGMYAITLELLVGVVVAFLHLTGFPFMSIIITLLVVAFNFLPAEQISKPKPKKRKK